MSSSRSRSKGSSAHLLAGAQMGARPPTHAPKWAGAAAHHTATNDNHPHHHPLPNRYPCPPAESAQPAFKAPALCMHTQSNEHPAA